MALMVFIKASESAFIFFRLVIKNFVGFFFFDLFSINWLNPADVAPAARETPRVVKFGIG